MTDSLDHEGMAGAVFACRSAILLLHRGGSPGGGAFCLLLLMLGTGSNVPTFMEILLMNWSCRLGVDCS
jgi:hypothetical protein